MHAIMYVFELPPKLSCNIRVSFELRYVMNWPYFLSATERADITLPNSSNPKFIFIPYLNVSPELPVFFALSDPARSTK